MALAKVNEQDIINAIAYIDKNRVPFHNQSTRYELVAENGKKYPPKYVIAVADHIVNGVDISPENYNAVEAKDYLQSIGFQIDTKQEKYELTVMSSAISSTDDRFTLDDISHGEIYKPLDAYFKSAEGKEVRRNYNKGERRNSNQTLPRIAFQVYEKQISGLSVEEKENFPTCQYNPQSDVIRGIYTSVEEYKKTSHRNTWEYLTYNYDNGRSFVIYCWNLFSTLLFLQECLKRFGNAGDSFVLVYREKEEKEIKEETETADPVIVGNYRNKYSAMLIESKNIIFRGAPGTGKSYLAREIAADIISNGYYNEYSMLTDEQKTQVEFVQFHPGYDYTDFVEGLRPKVNDDGSMGFELQDGVFKKFIARARKNYEDSQKSKETIEKEMSVQEAMADFFSVLSLGQTSSKRLTEMNLPLRVLMTDTSTFPFRETRRSTG